MPRAAALPASCIRCGRSASTPWRKKFAWHSPWLYLLIIFPGLLIYAIIALIVQKKMELNVPLCDVHHSDRKRYKLLGTVMLLGCLPLGIMLGTSFSEGLGWMTGLGMFVAALVFFSLSSLGVRPRKIDEHGGEFSGACREFLDLLPQQAGY